MLELAGRDAPDTALLERLPCRLAGTDLGQLRQLVAELRDNASAIETFLLRRPAEGCAGRGPGGPEEEEEEGHVVYYDDAGQAL